MSLRLGISPLNSGGWTDSWWGLVRWISGEYNAWKTFGGRASLEHVGELTGYNAQCYCAL